MWIAQVSGGISHCLYIETRHLTLQYHVRSTVEVEERRALGTWDGRKDS